MPALRIGMALLLGWATSWVVLNAGFVALRAVWAAYALADPDKAYTLSMLFVRLVIFSTMIASTSAIATLVSGNKRFSWLAGGVILAMSIPPHLYPGYVWNDYPAWYHIAYLFSIIPLAVLAGQLVKRLIPKAFGETSAA